MAPTTASPTMNPTTAEPTMNPTTGEPTTAMPTGTPTGVPTGVPTTGTASPTGALEVVVPFQLEYMIDPGLSLSDADLMTVEALTMRFLEEVLLLMYDFDQDTTMETFGLMVITSVDDNGVVTVDYEASVLFGMDSAVVPTMQDVDALLMAAFEGLNLDVYLDLLQNTSADNAFSTSTDVRYIGAARKRTELSVVERYQLSAKELVGVVGAGLIMMLGAGVMYYDGRRRRAERRRKVALTI